MMVDVINLSSRGPADAGIMEPLMMLGLETQTKPLNGLHVI
jgi:hypothetical protein